MLLSYHRGQTGVVLRVLIRDSTVATGAGKTGLTNAAAGLIISTIANNEATATAYTAAGSTIDTIATLGTYAAPTAGHCRFREVDATNHAGIYEVQLEDARLAVANARALLVSITGAAGSAPCHALIPLWDLDPYDAAAGGLTRLDTNIGSRLAATSYAAPLDAAGTRTALGMATNNLDTQLATIAGYIDTEVAAIKAKTDALPASWPANLTSASTLLTTSNVNVVAGVMQANLVQFAGQAPPAGLAGVPVVDVRYESGQLLRPALAAGGTTSVTLAASEPAGAAYANWLLYTTGGTGAGQLLRVTAYNAGTRVASVTDAEEATAPAATDATTTYELIPPRYSASAILPAPRLLDGLADGALTGHDALWAALSKGAGQEAKVGTDYVTKTVAGTVIRNFVLDDATSPTSRT